MVVKTPLVLHYDYRGFKRYRHVNPAHANILKKYGFATTKKKRSKVLPPPSSIIGVNKIFDRQKSWIERILWIIVLLTTSSFCLVQLCKFTTLFFNNPVIKQSDIIQLSTVKFPTICVCPGIIRQLLHIFYNLNDVKCPTKTFSCFSNDSYEQAMLDWYPYFNTTSQSILYTDEFAQAMSSQIKLYSSCRRVDSGEGNCEAEGKEFNVNRTTIDTVWGKCLILDTAQEIEYKGPFTYITLQFKNLLHENFTAVVQEKSKSLNNSEEGKKMKKSLKNHKIGLMISAQGGKVLDLQHHFLFYLSNEILQGFETHILLHRQEITLLNREQSPCTEEETFYKCYNTCFEEKMANTCNPTYLHKPGIKPCGWDEEFAYTFLQNINEYSKFNFTNCDCPPPCYAVRYITYTDVIDELSDKSILKVKFYFSDASYDEIVEKYSYLFNNCLSDFGGTLGFFLGFSILNIVELVDLAVHGIMKFF